MEVINESAIQIGRGTQFRARLNDDRVKEYAELFVDEKWPFETPCEVFFDGSEYYLVDGFHRYHAARTAGHDGIVCNVRKGTLRDAIKFALSANAKHGLHRSNDDKRKAVAFALADLEWSKLSSRAIADMCGVSDMFVGNIRKESGANRLHLESKRVGKDGKQQSPTKKAESKQVDAPAPQVDAWEDVDDEPEVKPSKPLPKTTMSQSPQELAASIHAAGETMLALIKEVNRLSDQVGGEWIDMQEVETRAKSLRKLIRGFAFWVDCPTCKGKGCNGCRNRGWLCVDRKQYLTQEQKDLLGVA